MDPFSTTAAAISLAELCIKTINLIRNARKKAESVIGELETLLNEIDSLRVTSNLVGDLVRICQDLEPQLPQNLVQRLHELDHGALQVVKECESPIRETGLIISDILGPVTSSHHSVLGAARTVLRRHSRREDVEQLRREVQSGQNRLQAFYISFNIVQVQGTATSIRTVVDDVRKLGFQLQTQFSLISASDLNNVLPGALTPMTGLLAAGLAGSVTLNKHFDVPRLVDTFYTGRQGLLRELKDAFEEPSKSTSSVPKIFVIHGFPGSGKTDFSLKFAEQYRELFWGIFVMQADSDKLLVNSFKRIVQYADKKVEPTLATAKHWLANQELPWLLIMDNADDKKLDMSKYFPASSLGCVLITTRNQDLKRWRNVGRRSFAFERLEPAEAKVVLLNAADEPNPPKLHIDTAASEISEELQCLPLALVSAGKTIRSKLCTWKNYLKWYKDSCNLISERLSSGVQLDEVETAKLTVIPTIEPHFIRLEHSNIRESLDALDLIHMLGYFHHRNISFNLLKLVVENADKDGLTSKKDSSAESKGHGIPAAVQREPYKTRITRSVMRSIRCRPVLPDVLRKPSNGIFDEHRLRAALVQLEALNLIRCDDNEELYSLHPLVHSWIRQRHSSTSKRAYWIEAANRALSQCVVLEAGAFSGGPSSFFNARELLPHVNHARRCQTEILEEFSNKIKDARIGRIHRGLIPTEPCWLTTILEAERCAKYSLVYNLCGEFAEAAVLQAEVRSVVISNYGMNNQASIRITLALAWTIQQLTEFGKAAALLEQAVKACKELHGANDPETLAVIDQHGLLLLYYGKLRDCTNAHKQAIAGFTSLGSKYLKQALVAKAHLGAVQAKYWNYEESRALCQEAVTGLEECEPNGDELLWAKESLAFAHGELGNGATACELMQDVLKGREERWGEQHPFTLWASVNTSRALWKAKRYDEALQVLEEPRQIASLTLGQKHFGYLASELLRACIMTDQGRYDEAQELLIFVDETHKGIMRERGTDHLDRIVSIACLMELYERRKDYQNAIETGEQVLEALRTINKEGRGWEHPIRPKIQNDMARLQALRDAELAPKTSSTADGLRQRQPQSEPD